MKRALRLPLLLSALALAGCPNPLGYTTPRTVAPGKVAHVVAIEAYDFRVGESSLLVPSAPSYQLRLGVVERLDAGLKISNLSGLGLDLKLNFYRSDALDLAVDPSASSLGAVAITLWNDPDLGGDTPEAPYAFDLPLVVGVNLEPQVSLVLRGGMLLVTAASDVEDEYDWLPSDDPWWLGHAGLGLDVRLSPRFAVHPAFSVLVDAASGEVRGVVGGVGVALGRLPHFAGQSL